MMIRSYISRDCREMAELFYQTVHTVNARDYAPEQLDAWANGKVNLEQWDASFRSHTTLVEERDGVIAGFADMDGTGYLDRLYVHKDYQGQGIATALCDALELAVPSRCYTTHASITARGFFEKRGYRAVKEQQVERQGVKLTNFVMEKKR
ncbi:MAG TPA: GNAT family N-acetyltransferase [Candidatus Faecousia intestinigallinarum]|nr:GNAT family N-acetyltransferase [Candidatus Faecousia intestinigallinarum]